VHSGGLVLRRISDHARQGLATRVRSTLDLRTNDMKKISILGSTGSIGRQTLNVVESLSEQFQVVALAAGNNLQELAPQIVRHRPEVVSVATAELAGELAGRLKAELEPGARVPEIHHGREGMLAVGTHGDADIVVSAAVGVVGLEATYEAVKLGRTVALSNKEVLVAAGELVMAAAAKSGRELLPVDSEHNAVHQCLRAGRREPLAGSPQPVASAEKQVPRFARNDVVRNGALVESADAPGRSASLRDSGKAGGGAYDGVRNDAAAEAAEMTFPGATGAAFAPALLPPNLKAIGEEAAGQQSRTTDHAASTRPSSLATHHFPLYPEVRRLVLTASGGPFRKTPLAKLAHVTVEQALAHPNWRMGNRITIDSATMMNKGFEIIEARWLFDMRPEQIEVIIHPQSTVHSFVEFVDGSVLAQLAPPDMRMPIQYALTYPERVASNQVALDWTKLKRLDFEKASTRRFPCLRLAREALKKGGAWPCALNAADEVAVAAFLEGRLPFLGIAGVIEAVLERTPRVKFASIADVLTADAEARQLAGEEVARFAGKVAIGG
jgi:1-deoxy-D-xylulose 5-phosphate reductoisomerase